ncbi:MAG: putative peptidoglycan glycosyltransferase FtsW [Calditrichia bacterium]|nr:cell division protein FtsW [Calditrichota bacterium]MCB0268878.1 cell division protein FtsW [Calditrichota bacterium]MCB0286055.1 cell division protein FtsW [Calditrichota bacterium]MCB9070139.1 cell division protein FtsW [Calditrichia bacterium]
MKRRQLNKPLVLAFFGLMFIGIIMVYSSSPFYAEAISGDHFYFLKRHLLNLFVGLIALVTAFSLPVNKIRGYTWIPLVIAGFLLMYAAIAGTRWVNFVIIKIQAVDIAKLAIILFFADSISRKEKIMSQFSEGLFPHLFHLALFSLLVLMQPDFSSASMLLLIGLTILFVSPVKLSHLALTGLAAVPVLIVAVVTSPYKMRRVISFLNPNADTQGIGYQVHQSLISLGKGGASGVGFANSTQKMFFLPEAHTDFIFSIIGEEWGFIGTLIVAGLFSVILYQGIKMALHAQDSFHKYLIVGITAHFVFYGMINMMVTLSIMPATGLPMPFVSYGGTALVLSCFFAGLMLNIAGEIQPVRTRRVKQRSPKSTRMATPSLRKA